MQIMDEIQAGLRYMFQTESKYTCLVTGSGVCAPCRAAKHILPQVAALCIGACALLLLPAAFHAVV